MQEVYVSFWGVEYIIRGRWKIVNKIINQFGCEITRCLFEEYPSEYLEYVFKGKLDVDDFVDQVILECIKYAYDYTQEKHSIRYFLKEKDILSDDVKSKYSRLMPLLEEYNRKEIEHFLVFGTKPNGELEGMNNISDKLQGYKFSELFFWEITNIGELELIKAIIYKRLMSVKKISNQKFKDIAKQYDKFVYSLKEQSLESDEKMVFNSLAFFTLEWKFSFNFLYQCIIEMAKNKLDKAEDVWDKIGILAGFKHCVSRFGYQNAADSRMIGYRESLIKDFWLKPEIKYQYNELLILVSAFTEMVKIDEKPIKEWFIENTNIEDWASFFKEYNVFKAADFNKNWTNENIRNMREICKIAFPENDKSRFYREETYFDIVMSQRGDIRMDKFDCYIEEYTNNENKLCARLREKKSNKKIIIDGNFYVWQHLLRFLASAKKNIELMPTVFDRDGTDIVAVRGFKRAENDEVIEISMDAIGAGYLFE